MSWRYGLMVMTHPDTSGEGVTEYLVLTKIHLDKDGNPESYVSAPDGLGFKSFMYEGRSGILWGLHNAYQDAVKYPILYGGDRWPEEFKEEPLETHKKLPVVMSELEKLEKLITDTITDVLDKKVSAEIAIDTITKRVKRRFIAKNHLVINERIELETEYRVLSRIEEMLNMKIAKSDLKQYAHKHMNEILKKIEQ